jgi:hypothetical protein
MVSAKYMLNIPFGKKEPIVCKWFHYILTYLLTNLLHGAKPCFRPFWIGNISDKCLSTRRNQKIHYHVHKSPLLVSILSQMNPLHNVIPCYFTIYLMLSSYLRYGLQDGLFSFSLMIKILYKFITSSMHVTCSAHFILLDLATVKTFDIEHYYEVPYLVRSFPQTFFVFSYVQNSSRISSPQPGAGVAQCYSAGLRAGWSSVRAQTGAGNFSLHYDIQTGSGANPASYTIDCRGSFPDHSPSSSAEVKNAWNNTSTPQYTIMAWYSVKKEHRDSLEPW